jgi:hypothetical protein
VTQHAGVAVHISKVVIVSNIVELQATLAVAHRGRGLAHEKPGRSHRVACLQQSHGLPPLLTE